VPHAARLNLILKASGRDLTPSALHRRRHNMLSADEMRRIREQYDMTPQAFAVVLGMSPATLGRYEGGALQDDLHDTAISAWTTQLAARASREAPIPKCSKLANKFFSPSNPRSNQRLPASEKRA